ncbi:unnamed protein product, partial [Darwinula stevensoni]
MDHQATGSSSVADTWCATFIENEKDLCPPPREHDFHFVKVDTCEDVITPGSSSRINSCVTQYPSMENAIVTYDGWDGKYPAPPSCRIIYTCPKPLRFNDGSDIHNATCSSRIDGAWDSSFHDRHVRCQESCVTQYPSMENATVTYDGWDGKYPAPPGSRIIYTCPKLLRFNDGSDIHNATCSSRIDDAWDSSFQDRHVRCQ